MAAQTSRQKKRYTVFVSYSTQDAWIARQMCRLIEARGKAVGVEVFLAEKDIDYGESFPEAIREKLEICDEFVVLLTRNSITRPWVLMELGAVWLRKKRITPIIDKVAPSEMPDIIIHNRAADLNAFDDVVEQIAGRARMKRKRT